MSKLTLKLDDLRVQSFETAVELRLRGTVRGHDHCIPGDSVECDSVNVCYESRCTTCGMVIQPFRAAGDASGPRGNCCV